MPAAKKNHYCIYRLYSWQKDIVVVKTSWIEEVLRKQCPVKDVPLKHHLLISHFMAGLVLDTKPQVLSKECSSSTPESTGTTAASVYNVYNAVWNKLEQDCSDNRPESKLVI